MSYLRKEEIIEGLKTRSLRELVRHNLENVKVHAGQLDPNGICNAGCWFCPVKYQGNPEEFVHQMTPTEMEVILQKIRISSVVSPTFNFTYTAHYNEILLYKYFEEMLELFRKYKLMTIVLSNGTTLTPEKTDVITRYPDVVCGLHLNIPSFEREDWAKKAGFDPKLFDNLQRNLDYFYSKRQEVMSVQINCATEQTGNVTQDSIITTTAKTLEIKKLFTDRYPLLGARNAVNVSTWLTDRAGELKTVKILNSKNKAGTVIGCNHTLTATDKGRVFGYYHINAKGDLFLCCNDYKMNYRFGNLLEGYSLDELWLSKEHEDLIMRSFDEICAGCEYNITQ